MSHHYAKKSSQGVQDLLASEVLEKPSLPSWFRPKRLSRRRLIFFSESYKEYRTLYDALGKQFILKSKPKSQNNVFLEKDAKSVASVVDLLLSYSSRLSLSDLRWKSLGIPFGLLILLSLLCQVQPRPPARGRQERRFNSDKIAAFRGQINAN